MCNWNGRVSFLFLVCAMATTAQADFILNTGLESGNLLTNGATVSEYQLVSRPAASVAELIATTSAGGFPIPPWLGDSSSSTWIRPNNNLGPGLVTDPAGQYVFETSFDLGSLDPLTASLNGRFATDNSGTIRLNGNDLGVTSTGFQTWTDVELTVGSGWFTTGVNTLQFFVDNAAGASGNPVGLRVELSVRAVPEPTAFLLVGIVGIPLLAIRRRGFP